MKMMIKKLLTLGLTIIIAVSACKIKDGNPMDTEYPAINVTSAQAFPKQCSVIKCRNKIFFQAWISDNQELGSVSIDIDHNFDQHTPSTEVANCDMEPIKMPVKPFLIIESFAILKGKKTFEIQQEINIPDDVDPGEYHLG